MYADDIKEHMNDYREEMKRFYLAHFAPLWREDPGAEKGE